MALFALIEKRADHDCIREMLAFAAERLMGFDVDALTGAPLGAKSPDRLAQRNGYRARPWDTRAGTIELKIPRLRTGSLETPLAYIFRDVFQGVRLRPSVAGQLRCQRRRSRGHMAALTIVVLSRSLAASDPYDEAAALASLRAADSSRARAWATSLGVERRIRDRGTGLCTR